MKCLTCISDCVCMKIQNLFQKGKEDAEQVGHAFAPVSII